MSSRRKSRERALQLLFQQEVNEYSAREISEIFWKLHPADPETQSFAQFLFTRASSARAEIDELIRRHSLRWRLERMAAVDRNLLRVAVAELLFSDTPETVVLDETIEIARRFSTEDSTEFVNGVLDGIVRELRARSSQETPGSDREPEDG